MIPNRNVIARLARKGTDEVVEWTRRVLWMHSVDLNADFRKELVMEPATVDNPHAPRPWDDTHNKTVNGIADCDVEAPVGTSRSLLIRPEAFLWESTVHEADINRPSTAVPNLCQRTKQVWNCNAGYDQTDWGPTRQPILLLPGEREKLRPNTFPDQSLTVKPTHSTKSLHSYAQFDHRIPVTPSDLTIISPATIAILAYVAPSHQIKLSVNGNGSRKLWILLHFLVPLFRVWMVLTLCRSHSTSSFCQPYCDTDLLRTETMLHKESFMSIRKPTCEVTMLEVYDNKHPDPHRFLHGKIRLTSSVFVGNSVGHEQLLPAILSSCRKRSSSVEVHPREARIEVGLGKVDRLSNW